jgi:hypothetical protein
MQADIGHNQPPTLFSFATDTMRALSDWMAEKPQISSEDDAREAKLLLDRAKNCAADIEAERVALVTPLNEQLDAINDKYKSVHNKDGRKPGLLDKVVNELKSRVTAFLQIEEDKRLAIAEAKRREAEEAERIAREAWQRQQEAIANAHAGELGVDVTQVVVEADRSLKDFEKAEREAARADRDTHVKIGGGWGNAASLRSKETLIVVSYNKAITAIGKNEKIETAILSAARDYRKLTGNLPEGVIAETTRTL